MFTFDISLLGSDQNLKPFQPQFSIVVTSRHVVNENVCCLRWLMTYKFWEKLTNGISLRGRQHFAEEREIALSWLLEGKTGSYDIYHKSNLLKID